MFDMLRKLKPELLVGLVFVLLLHAVALYALWRYRILSAPDEAVTVMVNLINPPLSNTPKPPKPPKPPRSEQAKPKPRPIVPPKPQQLVAETPVVLPNDPVAPPPPPKVIDVSPPVMVEVPPLPPQPVILSGELSVSCPKRSPPSYPDTSIRLNEQGRVVLRVELNTDGRVSNVQIKSSSGYRRLDDAAVSVVKNWHCKPTIRNGVAVSALAHQPFVFELEEK